jgi:hypothetical protein
MGKSANDLVLDGLLEVMEDNANLLCACSTEPTTRTEAVVTYMLATVAIDSSDFTIADGGSGGRKATITAQSGITITNNGTVAHLAIVDNSELYFVTTTSSQALVAGNLLNIPAWTITVNDPA